MNNLFTSYIRTGVPIVVGSVISYLVVKFGFVIDESVTAQLTTGLTGLIIGAYYVVARLLERKFPKLGVLLGSTAKPVYVEPKTAAAIEKTK
jgi:uncharacterized protein (DUF697 family)